MSDISNKTLSAIVGLALVVSLIGLFSLPNGIVSLTGFGTTGLAKINITENAALNVTVSVIDFGNGSVETYVSSCTLTTSEASGDPRNCFLPTGTSADGATDGFHIVNVGNVRLNVTANSTKSSPVDFWGTNVGSERFALRCSGNGTYTNTNFSGIYFQVNGNDQVCVNYLNATAGQDEFRMDINITIPDIALGVKNDTITFTGSKA